MHMNSKLAMVFGALAFLAAGVVGTARASHGFPTEAKNETAVFMVRRDAAVEPLANVQVRSVAR